MVAFHFSAPDPVEELLEEVINPVTLE